MRGVLERVASAVEDLYAREAALFRLRLGERTLTHRFAVHVEKQFPEWDTDCDYTRLHDRIWLLPKPSIVSTDDTYGKSMYPDVAVHRREIPDNLLAVEIRKADNPLAFEHDQQKLRAMTDPHRWFAYRIGVGLTLGEVGVAASEVYVAGRPDGPLSQWFSHRLNR